MIFQQFSKRQKKVNSCNGLKIKFSDCAFKTNKTVHYKITISNQIS